MKLNNSRITRLTLSVLLVAAVSVLAACSNGKEATSSGKKVTISDTAPASGCGSYTAAAPPDPDGVVKSIGGAYAKGLAGYSAPVRKSAWSDWKPKHDPPYTVGVAWNQLTTPFQLDTIKGIKDTLKQNPDVGKVLFSSTGTNTDVGQEISQMNALLRKKPDIIILEPLTAASFAKQYKQAAAAGIPVLLVLDSYDSPDVVNIGGNNVLSALQAGSGLVRIMGGKGNLVDMHAIPGSTPDNDTDIAVKQILKNCPNIKKVADLYGLYIASAAKAEMLKFLGTNPAPVNGVMQTAGMAGGIMQAFDQTGRKIPPVVDIANSKASLGYWRNNRDSYTGIGTGLGGVGYGTALANVAGRMLAGQGIKTNAVIQELSLITDKTLDQWSEPSWNLDTPGSAEGPAGAFGADDFLNPLFNDPQPLKKN